MAHNILEINSIHIPQGALSVNLNKFVERPSQGKSVKRWGEKAFDKGL